MSQFRLLIFLPQNKELYPGWRRFSQDIVTQSYDAEKMMEAINPAPNAIIALAASNEMPLAEVAQSLRMTYPEFPIFLVTDQKSDFDKNQLIKNGFTQAYLLPWEKHELAAGMELEMIYAINPEMRNYRPIKAVDMYPNMELPFDTKLFMPKNGKFLTFGREGEALSAQKLEQLKSNNLNTLYVHSKDTEKFHTYVADALKRVGKSGPSETEKEKILREGIRALVSEMFVENSKENTFKQSQMLLEDLRKSVRLMIGEANPDILRKIEQVTGQQSDFYGHLSRVSMYATLFAIVLDIPKPEELGVAGLLHDIGFTALPGELSEKPYADLSPTLQEAYIQHAEKSLEIIKLKRMVIVDTVQKAIAQHHERIDRQGYPNKLSANKIIPEAQILAIADQFDYLTSNQIGVQSLSPLKALQHLLQENTKDPVQQGIDPKYIRDLIKKMEPQPTTITQLDTLS